ncbi:MAG: hypothetical protein M1831_001644 [Alyxoria varia]|nr:MAG: hypothetical protein M1831_001644 [Alyxoria varia]
MAGDHQANATPAEPSKLSASDFKTYNRMAETMDLYHNNFRYTWQQLWDSVSPAASSNGSGLSPSNLIKTGLRFVSSLSMHHSIEERHIFPYLGSRMPAFGPDGEPLKQHEQIHQGLKEMEKYLLACKHGERGLAREDLKVKMESWGQVLWQHMDDEVWQLGAERMRKYWSLEEMRRMPM